MTETVKISCYVSTADINKPLNLNDGTNFKVANEIFGSAVTWRRQTAKSPFVDGEVVTGKVLELVQDKFAVDVMGATQSAMLANIKTLISAFSQDSFALMFGITEVTNTKPVPMWGFSTTGPLDVPGTQVTPFTDVPTPRVPTPGYDTKAATMNDWAMYVYECQGSDYTMDWSVPRMHGRRTQVKFQLRRSPVPLAGV